MPVLETKNLTYQYGAGTPFCVTALDDVSVSIEKGELVGIIGHTGSGKSTLMQHFNALLKPDKGQVLLEGKDINENKQAGLEARFKVGLCFQYPEYQLFEATVYKDIAYGPANMKLDGKEVDARVRQAAEYVGIPPDMLEKSPFDLSGGEKRRAAIAGVMAMRPEILILDEPTAGLDPSGRSKIMELIVNYKKTTGNTVLLVSHSMDEIAAVSDRILVMKGGKIAMFDSVKHVFGRVSELISMGLFVPEITNIMLKLKERGVGVRTDIFTLEGAANELLHLLFLH
ncbi:MAG: energy-coupling factor transporter ATPase [Oscillospiraceae bacterium]|nr:energy-coupling factor transporter ATPase [Oscillospiraceae bacterium]